MSNPTDREVEEFFQDLLIEAKRERMAQIETEHPAFAFEKHIFGFQCDAYEKGEAKSPDWAEVPPDSHVWAPLCRSCAELEHCLSATQNRIMSSLMGWTLLISNTFDGAILSEEHEWWKTAATNQDFYRPNPEILQHALARASGVVENLVIIHGTLLANLTQENAFLRDIMPGMPAYDPEQVEIRRTEILKERRTLQRQILDHIKWTFALVIAATRYSILARLDFPGGDLEGIDE